MAVRNWPRKERLDWPSLPGHSAPNVVGTRGAIEYLGEDGRVVETVNAETQCAVYLAWCREHGVRPAEQIVG
jgi:hypothetical protein